MVKLNHLFRCYLLNIILIAATGCTQSDYSVLNQSSPSTQIKISRVEAMPSLPQPYEMKDWHQTTVDFDKYVYDFSAKGQYLPLIWIDSTKKNFNQNTYGLFTAIGDVREGPEINQGQNHEAIGALGSIISATLVGIDKSNQNGNNYPLMVKNYFNKDNGYNIIMNFTNKSAHIGGGYGNDYWYDVYNNVLFYGVANYYPKTDGYPEITRTIADQFLKSAFTLHYNFSYSFFDFKNMKGGNNHIPTQEDVAAGYAFILYSAWIKFHEEKYLNGAIKSLKSLENQKENRNYEILMPFGAYIGARLNAEQGQKFDITRFLNWSFDGNATNREGWGVIVDQWGGYDVSGLCGSTVHNGGYGFAMNTFDMAWPLLPLVRYDQRYALSVGKWILNAANAARLFYPYDIADSLQALPDKKKITKNVIAYEGLIKKSIYENMGNKSPVAQGDGPLWAPGMPQETMFSIYGSGHVGFFGGTIHPTDVKGILQLDCNITDMYQSSKNYPTWLLYNPYNEVKKVKLPVGNQKIDIYESISKKIISQGVVGETTIVIPPGQAIVLIYLPSGAKMHADKHILYANDIPIDYQFSLK